MQCGNTTLRRDFFSAFMSSNLIHKSTSPEEISLPSVSRVVDPRDADLLHFRNKVRAYEDQCGFLSNMERYGRAKASMCNAKVTEEQMVAASVKTCT
ncbi:hypothetical protein FEM48_Zijuj10G0006900 [Ziziphus jujuba var. spinosa]|uniref:Legumain prodomain domain-containing protein n=1 Tax=Ziziphus jujuba var. spinosa TaxID=714518 RepID=A0A978UK98_ZIZJJ|nr:hypothetical protein FEM48_Zijuj10G0006900 [Ziziphus jujuba var. spinosa]